jgi:hypothetical protein
MIHLLIRILRILVFDREKGIFNLNVSRGQSSDSDVKPHKQHSQALESAMWEAESACLQLHRHPP